MEEYEKDLEASNEKLMQRCAEYEQAIEAIDLSNKEQKEFACFLLEVCFDYIHNLSGKVHGYKKIIEEYDLIDREEPEIGFSNRYLEKMLKDLFVKDWRDQQFSKCYPHDHKPELPLAYVRRFRNMDFEEDEEEIEDGI